MYPGWITTESETWEKQVNESISIVYISNDFFISMYIKMYNKSSKITCKLINKMGCNQYHLKGKIWIYTLLFINELRLIMGGDNYHLFNSLKA